MRSSPVDYLVEDRGYKTPCWIWQLKITKWGYAGMTVSRRAIHAHRYYIEQYAGPIPEEIDGERAEPYHLCRVRSCINPEHFEIVPQSENIRRGLVATLTEEEARSIPGRYIAGESQHQIAKSLGIGQVQVSRILSGSRRAGGVIVPGRRDRNLKLSPLQVAEIRKRVKAGEFQRDIAKAFGMGQSQISRIVRGEAWSSAAMTA